MHYVENDSQRPSLNGPLLTLTGEAARVFLSRVVSSGGSGSTALEIGTYRLVVPHGLVSDYLEGAIRAATPKAGDASVLLKNVGSGKIVGRALLLGDAGAPVEAGAAAGVGLTNPVVAVALVMGVIVIGEVHAINRKLVAISTDVHELVVMKRAELVGEVNAARQKLAYGEAAISRGAAINEMFTDRQLALADEIEKVRQTYRALLDERAEGYEAGSATAGPAIEAFGRFASSTEVAMSTCTFLIGLPPAENRSLDAYLRASEDRLKSIAADIKQASVRLLEISDRYSAHLHARANPPRAPRKKGGFVGELQGEARDLTRIAGGSAFEAADRVWGMLGKPKPRPLPDAFADVLRVFAGSGTSGFELELTVGKDNVQLLGANTADRDHSESSSVPR